MYVNDTKFNIIIYVLASSCILYCFEINSLALHFKYSNLLLKLLNNKILYICIIDMTRLPPPPPSPFAP